MSCRVQVGYHMLFYNIGYAQTLSNLLTIRGSNSYQDIRQNNWNVSLNPVVNVTKLVSRKSAINGHLSQSYFFFFFFIMLTLTVDTVFVSALSPLSVNMVLWTITGAISPVIFNVYANGSVDTKGCYNALHLNP